jgi:hypothetical protein
MIKLPKLTTTQVDKVNIGLMVISLILAFILPFEVFLFSYAVLGPLHYLTEISWLHQKNYFVPNVKKLSFWIFPIIAIILTVVLVTDDVRDHILKWQNGPKFEVKEKLFPNLWNTNLIIFLFGIACIVVLIPKFWIKVVAFGILTFFVLYVNVGQNCISCTSSKTQNNIDLCDFESPKVARSWIMKNCADVNGDGQFTYDEKDNFKEGLKYTTPVYFFTAYLPTLIHVYIFTMLFMLFGALKSKSKFGILSVVILVICGALPFIWDPPFLHYTISGRARQDYDASFLGLNKTIFENIFSLASTPENIYGSRIGIMLTRFIAFAYTYHYLNWFSKTSIIQWHKMPKLNLGIVLVLWISAVLLYWYKYETGLTALLFLSFLHVFLEFPLNFHSFVGIIKSLFGKKTAPA